MGKFNCPVLDARLTSSFGWRNIGRGKEWHQGIDLASPIAGKKVPVYASADGTVSRSQTLGTYGNVVMIKHVFGGKVYETNYAHLDSRLVKVGDKVKQGQKIGIMGNTGGSFGVHLHFEIHNGSWVTGQKNAVDPMKWIQLNTCIPLDDKVANPKIDYTKKLGYSAPKDSKAYRIHTDSYKSKSDAEKAKCDLVKQGFIKYAEVFGNDKNGYRLQTGKYNTQKEAEYVALKLLEAKKIGYASIIGSHQ